ncbi:DNA-directed RNA polymerase subunit K [Candidatus Nanohaloarchaea archaeon]|nr:DNA-directed RNA polymerase subunit K [Candidatus Nanohaloarchaea archaeon]
MKDYTRYEKARILGARSLQIAMGAPSFVESSDKENPIDIAKKEMEDDKLPITVK